MLVFAFQRYNMTPKKQILSPAHLVAFKQSDACAEILQFVDDLNESVVGVKLGDVHASARTQPLIDVLDRILETARSIPPLDTQSRFGNPAFRTFYDAVKGDTVPKEYREEVGTYLKESWGNRERIDYGSGMELNFLMWLLCHVKLGLVQREDYAFLVLGVFWRYIQVMRYLQSTYWLEPAGSHGVWGLDDYQFLPFLWGAGQLSGESSVATLTKIICTSDQSRYTTRKCSKRLAKTTCIFPVSPLSIQSRRHRCGGTRPCSTTSRPSRRGKR